MKKRLLDWLIECRVELKTKLEEHRKVKSDDTQALINFGAKMKAYQEIIDKVMAWKEPERNFSPELDKILEEAHRQALREDASEITLEHMAWAIAQTKLDAEPESEDAARILRTFRAAFMEWRRRM